MSITQTPPAPPAAPVPPAGGPRTAPRVIAILTIALGAAILLAVAWTGIRAAVVSGGAVDDTRSLEVAGVTDLAVDAGATDLRVVFADVPEATLELRDAAAGWRFERTGATLRVASPDHPWFFPTFGQSNGEATLTLPADLAGADARLTLGAGSLLVAGDFGDLVLDVSAGRLVFEGDARTLDADVSAGRAEIDVTGVGEAELDLSAGDMFVRMTGSAPDAVTVGVGAGTLELTLPDEVYDVRSDVSAGDLVNGLRTATDAASRVSVEVSAGTVRLLAD